ncbi:wax ester/triacylglycerol synthase family O-acyltransferase [Gordonia sp. JH63]|uniref:WS/DGAT/MGAT family O-acyltransferase n=1 Tax=Gordonia TaxID=2053 RepID=UPI00131FF159|nr:MULTISPECIES: wax ester/triacylglycerol synthase family O-acyltransferase [Gordonia]MBN0975178.1 wax ester/triacylglycerol synthase family O-acyltransferase [Gordonia sp. BP-119]MBN0985322.1 wax ester/triacylglycerol synthase family O-acyltransferase [Gordonia sp. BP-94]QHD87487.1 wax ester/triacylglycerol synthase family O-acyltransferase [Gordonia sp. JH63]UPG67896.1 wax ester/triacylglycerol synthase family O-acyltransferase [Gordonia hongkongensis]
MPYMPVTSSMFLLAETREQPMHVGGLQLFVPREGQSSSELAEEIIEAFCGCTEVHPTFRKRPAVPVTLLGNVAWSFDDEIDFDYHVRRTVLPRPGRVRELLRYVSLNHGALMDRFRPMWEIHVIEGLDDGRVALYSKIHHSVVDGVSALRLLQRTLSDDPDDRSGTAPWDPALVERRPPRPSPSLRSRVSSLANVAGQVAGLGPAAAKVAVAGLRDPEFVAPLGRAPRTILDVAIGSARRFASQQWEIDRLRAVADARNITLNDVIVAMCSGALRSYLIDQDALPDAPLIAAVPVSMHTDGDDDGNAVTAILVSLATDEPDPERRLDKLVESARHSKSVVRGLRPLQALALGAANFAPLAFATVPGFVQYVPPQFNIIISNVPGPSKHLYWNGARLDGVYPVSIPTQGLALNITVTSTAEHINFGLIGARAQLPSLQRLLTHLDTALEELEKVARTR